MGKGRRRILKAQTDVMYGLPFRRAGRLAADAADADSADLRRYAKRHDPVILDAHAIANGKAPRILSQNEHLLTGVAIKHQ